MVRNVVVDEILFGQFVYARDKVKSYDVENFRLSIIKEIQGVPVRHKSDVCGLLWCKMSDPGTGVSPRTDSRRSEGE